MAISTPAFDVLSHHYRSHWPFPSCILGHPCACLALIDTVNFTRSKNRRPLCVTRAASLEVIPSIVDSIKMACIAAKLASVPGGDIEVRSIQCTPKTKFKH